MNGVLLPIPLYAFTECTGTTLRFLVYTALKFGWIHINSFLNTHTQIWTKWLFLTNAQNPKLCILSFGWFPSIWILCADVSEHRIQLAGNHPNERIQHSKHSESLKSRILNAFIIKSIYFKVSNQLTVYWPHTVMYLSELSVESHIHFKLRHIIIQMWLLMIPHVTEPHKAACIFWNKTSLVPLTFHYKAVQ